MPTNIIDDPTTFPVIITPVDTDIPNAASIAGSVQLLSNRTAYLNRQYQLENLIAGTWYRQSSGVAVNLLAVAPSQPGVNTPYVAVGVGAGPCTIITSPDGNTTWTTSTSVGTSTTAFVVRIVNTVPLTAVLMNGASGQNLQTANDPTSGWTLRATGIVLANGRGGIDYSPSLGVWCIVGGVGGVAAVSTSTDGTTYTARTLGGATNQMTDVFRSESLGLFIAVGYNTSTFNLEIWTTPNPVTTAWTQRLSGITLGAAGFIRISGSTLTSTIAVASPNGTNYSSINGVTWSLASSAFRGRGIFNGRSWIYPNGNIGGASQFNFSVDNLFSWTGAGEWANGSNLPFVNDIAINTNGRLIAVGGSGLVLLGMNAGISLL